jgi:uncharacterized phosphosugar-binding protein
MLINKYFDLLQLKIEEIAADTKDIKKAADLCVEALVEGGAIHIFDSGHMVSHELIRRAGGLVALNRLEFNLNVDHVVRARADIAPAKILSYGYISHIFDTNQLRSRDVLFVGSVSGKSANVVELAQQARAHGLKVIAITALAYSPKLESQHPSGLHLYESADLVLDNHATYGDAMLEVEGLDYPVFPMSGIGAAAVLWGVTAGIIEGLLARGLKPTVYPSINRPNGPALVKQVETDVQEKGY